MMADEYTGHTKKTLLTVFMHMTPIGVNVDTYNKITQSIDSADLDVDYIELYRTFEDNKTVDVAREPLRTKEKIEEYFKDTIADKAKKYDKFMFVFLTYKGEKDGLIHIKDTKNYDIKNVFKLLTADELKHIRGKPKLFLIQADDIYLMPDMKTQYQKGPVVTMMIPSDIDKLVITSHIPQRFNDNNDKPSLLIQAFCDVIKEEEKMSATPTSLNELTVNITNKVKTSIDDMLDESGKGDLELPPSKHCNIGPISAIYRNIVVGFPTSDRCLSDIVNSPT